MKQIENLEILRKKAVKKIIVSIVLGSFLALFVLLGVIIKDGFDPPILAIIPYLIYDIFFTFGLIQSYANNDIKRFKKEYKRIIVKAIEEMFNNVKFKVNSPQDYDAIGNVRDSFKGQYKDVRFSFDEGVFEFKFNKPFQQILQISERGFRNRSIWLTDLAQLNTLRKIEIEDAEFNKKFAIYAQNEEEAFYMLTPNFIQGIKKLSNMKNTRLDFQFEDKYLRITVVNFKNWFEGKLFKRIINESSTRESVMQDIEFITDFVDELSLDNDLFKKETSEYD